LTKLLLKSIGIFAVGALILAVIARFTFHGKFEEMDLIPQVLIGILYCLPVLASLIYFSKGYKSRFNE
jgi:hypothetical protein